MTTTVDATVGPHLAPFEVTDQQWFLGMPVWLRANSAQTGGAVGLVEQLVPPGFGSPYHLHRNEDESFYVLEGQIRFFTGGESFVLEAGGFAFLPRGIAHGFRTEGATASRSLLFATPGGFVDFVAELSSPAAPAGPPDMGALMAAAERHGIEILGPLPE